MALDKFTALSRRQSDAVADDAPRHHPRLRVVDVAGRVFPLRLEAREPRGAPRSHSHSTDGPLRRGIGRQRTTVIGAANDSDGKRDIEFKVAS